MIKKTYLPVLFSGFLILSGCGGASSGDEAATPAVPEQKTPIETEVSPVEPVPVEPVPVEPVPVEPVPVEPVPVEPVPVEPVPVEPVPVEPVPVEPVPVEPVPVEPVPVEPVLVEPEDDNGLDFTLAGQADYQGRTQSPVNFTFYLNGADSADSFEMLSGVLPEGLTLQQTANNLSISGTPMYAGFYTLTLRASKGEKISDFSTTISIETDDAPVSEQSRTAMLDTVADSYTTRTTDFKKGTASTLHVRSTIYGESLQSVLRFNTPATSDTLQSAYLELYVKQQHDGDMPIVVEGVANNWNEGNVHWGTFFIFGNPPYATRMPFFGPKISYNIANGSVNTKVRIDVTDLVNSAQRTDNSAISFFLSRYDKENSSVQFNSKEASNNPPKLVLEYQLDNSQEFAVSPEMAVNFLNTEISETIDLNFSKPVASLPISAVSVDNADLLALVRKSATHYQLSLVSNNTNNAAADPVLINFNEAQIQSTANQILATASEISLPIMAPVRLLPELNSSIYIRQDIRLDGGQFQFDVPPLSDVAHSVILQLTLKDIRDDGVPLIIRKKVNGAPTGTSVSKIIRYGDGSKTLLIDISKLFEDGLAEGIVTLGFEFNEVRDPSHVTRGQGAARGNPTEFPRLRINDRHPLPAAAAAVNKADWTQTRITTGQDRISVHGGAIIEYDKVPQYGLYTIMYYPHDDQTTPELEGEGMLQSGLEKEGTTPHYSDRFHVWLRMGKGTYIVTPYRDTKSWTLFNTAEEAYYHMPTYSANHLDPDIKAYFDSMDERLDLHGKTSYEKLRAFYVFLSKPNDDFYYNSAVQAGNAQFLMQKVLQNKRNNNGDRVGMACWGYTSMFTSYARYLGYAAHQADTNGHIWTLIRFDDSWYVFDATPGYGLFKNLGREIPFF